jgi:hypothetical protein
MTPRRSAIGSLLFVSAAFSTPSAAQVHTLTALQPAGSLLPRFVLATDPGSCAVAGPSLLLGGTMQPVLALYDASGALAWAATPAVPPGSPSVHAMGLTRGPAGGLFLGFASQFVDPGLFGVAVYASDGTPVWVATQATSGPANYGGLVVDELGRPVTAVSLTYPHANRDITLVALTAAGTPAWDLHYGAVEGQSDDAIALVAGSNGRVVAVGTSSLGLSGPPRITTLFVDSLGSLQAAVPYPSAPPSGPVRHDAVDVARDAQYAFYVLGRRQSSPAVDAAVLVKYDANGTLLWSREHTVDGAAILWPHALDVASDGRATFCATSHHGDLGRRIAVAQYDAQGNLLWESKYGGTESDYRGADVFAGDGRARVIGYGVKGNGFDYDLATLEYEPDGALRYARLHGGAIGVETRADAITVGVDGTLHVVGYESALGVGNATALLRYADSGFQQLGIETHGLQPLVGTKPGGASAGSGGHLPQLSASGSSGIGGAFTLQLSRGLGGAPAVIAFGGAAHAVVDLPLFGGALQVLPTQLVSVSLSGTFGAPGVGSASLPFVIPLDATLLGGLVRFQAGVLDPQASGGVALSNGLELWIG